MHIVCWVIMFKFESVDILREINELIRWIQNFSK